MAVAATDIKRTIDAVWRIESARLIGALTRLTRDLGRAEELAQDALEAALRQWPESGVPARPGAWLMAAARRRAVDGFRRDRMIERKHRALERDREDGFDPAIEEGLDDDLGDDLLPLIFTSCHPVLSTEARVALTLKVLGGLDTGEIARAFLLPEATIAQRIVRAKRRLADTRVPFEVPHGAERAERLASVLAVIYLIFNEGYSATAGEDWVRPDLCEDALRLGRILAERMPEEAEVHGLVALMELHASRLAARTAADGTPILLLDQNRSRWDRLLIVRGLAALARAEAIGPSGPYTLQAAIAACHARAATAAETDWVRIAALYAALAGAAPSPVVELNRAVALAMAFGPAAGLAHADSIAGDPALASYHLLPAVRGDLLARLGRNAEAAEEFGRAAALTRNVREQALLLDRAAACGQESLQASSRSGSAPD